MTASAHLLKPPFLPPHLPAEDPSFPVVISQRAASRLYWHVIHNTQSGIGLLFHTNAGIQDVEYADASRLDKSQYRISRFGRIPIAVLRSEEPLFKGFMLDARSFPPGPPNIHLIEMHEGLWPAASDPGRLTLSTRRLEILHPELFKSAGPLVKLLVPFLSITSQFGSKPNDQSWINRWIGVDDPDGQSQVMESLATHLWQGDANPALVVKTNPLTIAAYTPDIDNVMLLRLPESTPQDLKLELRPGTKLVTCNTYGTMPPELCDISPGPEASGTWTNCNCVIADLITEDAARLAELKNSFSSSAWRKCESHAANRLQQQHPCRDGRPNYAWIPIAWQRLPSFRVRGGYCK